MRALMVIDEAPHDGWLGGKLGDVKDDRRPTRWVVCCVTHETAGIAIDADDGNDLPRDGMTRVTGVGSSAWLDKCRRLLRRCSVQDCRNCDNHEKIRPLHIPPLVRLRAPAFRIGQRLFGSMPLQGGIDAEGQADLSPRVDVPACEYAPALRHFCRKWLIAPSALAELFESLPGCIGRVPRPERRPAIGLVRHPVGIQWLCRQDPAHPSGIPGPECRNQGICRDPLQGTLRTQTQLPAISFEKDGTRTTVSWLPGVSLLECMSRGVRRSMDGAASAVEDAGETL